MEMLRTFLAMLPVVVLLDLLWLGVIMKDFYRMHLGHLMSGNVVWPAAIIFYLVFTSGLLFFAVLPNVTQGLVRTVLIGALFGLIAYATYDLTNQATLRDWPILVTVVDILWGGVLSGLVAAAGYYAFKLF